MESYTIRLLLQAPPIGKTLEIQGWVRTKRESKHVLFIHLNDGSTLTNLQIVMAPNALPEKLRKSIQTGASLRVVGTLVASQGKGQGIELQATSLSVLGEADPTAYPLQPKRHSMEFLREHLHLRARTNTFSAVFRIRHGISHAIHQFFHERGFFWLHTPIITGSDAEGAGEMFQVTSLALDNVPKTATGKVDFQQDFFGKPVHLSVSGQLEGEVGALALGKVYTFGPTFRAENSHTSRHLAEFWMVEPEMAFYNLADTIALGQEMLQYIARYVTEHHATDLDFLNKRAEKIAQQKKGKHLSLTEKMAYLLDKKFHQITYTEAIELLQKVHKKKPNLFAFPINEWGQDLQSEHEHYLTKMFNSGVVITDYPKEIKAFYMRHNEDGKTVAAMDMVLPEIGEIIGGSQREERIPQLIASMQHFHIDPASLDWYLDTRRFGSVVHSGFGLGLERLILYMTGIQNIRDVIPFPRTPGHAQG